VTAQQVAEQMADALARMYVELAKGKVTQRSRVGMKIPIVLVTDQGLEAALQQQAIDVADRLLHARLRFNPQWVLDRLRKYYKAINVPFPYQGKTIDENTKLSREEIGVLTGFLKAALINDLKGDVAATQGMYAQPADGRGTGKIFARKESAEDSGKYHELAGTLAHELAHAYAERNWWDFLDALSANDLPRTGELAEGMAVHFERIIVYEWLKDQPTDTPVPLAGYRDQPEVAQTAQQFLDAVGKDAAYEAYFGGWISFKNIDRPQDAIQVGKNKKTWKWPW
jgi:hypothetical protein